MPADATTSEILQVDIDTTEADAPKGRFAKTIGAIKRRPWLIAGIVILLVALAVVIPTFMEMLDTTIANVAPSIAALPSVALYPGESYSTKGSFTDPGADPWTATVDYGLGAGPAPLPLAGKTFTLSKAYTAVGSYTVRVTVADDDASASRTAVVNVLSVADGIVGMQAALQLYVTLGRISQGGYQQLNAMLGAALNTINNGQPQAARVLLDNVQVAIRRLETAGELSKSDAASLRTLVSRFIKSLALP